MVNKAKIRAYSVFGLCVAGFNSMRLRREVPREAGVGVDVELDRNESSDDVDAMLLCNEGRVEEGGSSQEGGWTSSSSYNQSIWWKVVESRASLRF